jgi:kynurenine formamidase
MNLNKILAILLPVILLFLILPSYADQLVDLTHPLDDSTVHWPTAEAFQLTPEFEGKKDFGYYSSYKFTTSEHLGTHIDAPKHFAEGKPGVDKIPLNRLVGDAVIVDVSSQCKYNPDYLVTIEDLQQWEAINQQKLDERIVVIKTGYEKYWKDHSKYLGTKLKGTDAVKDLHFPGLDPRAAKWLARKKKIKAVGIDTASIDYGQSKDFESHRNLAEKDVVIMENLMGLDELGAYGFTVIALPLKITDGSGSPARIIAVKKVNRSKDKKK